IFEVGFLGCAEARGGKRRSYPLTQLGGGLVGEGQAEYLAWADPSGGDEPDHARGHDRGLSRARAGHDHAGFQWCGDRRQLFLGVRHAEDTREVAWRLNALVRGTLLLRAPRVVTRVVRG